MTDPLIDTIRNAPCIEPDGPNRFFCGLGPSSKRHPECAASAVVTWLRSESTLTEMCDRGAMADLTVWGINALADSIEQTNQEDQ